MHSYYITGASGIKLFVRETGNPRGRPLLMMHGYSQNSLSWKKQLCSELAQEFRIIAFDLRGHGLSEKPIYGYDSMDWAGDIHALIINLELIQPILVGWSYGGFIILDYIRHYGEASISGIVFVDAGTSLGTTESVNFSTPAIKCLFPGLDSNDALVSSGALQQFLGLLFYYPPCIEDFYFILGFNTAVPYYVRKALDSRVVSNDELLASICKPTFVIYGMHDKIVTMAQTMHIIELVPNVYSSFYENSGHSPFWENPKRFNCELAIFAHSMT
ncbi:alpha/beta fold hydrolase [Paenibacillus prosopidis]|uniref:Pimeloyl-ACP methyl ester carboxylesterase n=1 Tax=Paenibacillus prosopidis TaxID=630520 RepID=A0A368VPN5_9BACL|nr:alpha/beta hydrolase [Paenibacillus prosopidis]RCW43468.1 pimeloyl-ACP methyl ester carboxylesterase [Paenibacillus prosopidis]